MTKQEIEFKSELSIRRGFDKFLNKTLCFLNYPNDINKLSKLDCINIVRFINKSNTKLSESYWVLRTDLSKNEYDLELIKLKKQFVESSYKHTNRKNVQHKFQKQNFSRGYSGWMEIHNQKFYCRSQGEFIWITYLHSIYNPDEYVIKMEDKIFYLDDVSYKPDIFVYKNNILIKLFEIKPTVNDISQKYYDFKLYFQKLNIQFEILTDQNLILKQHPEIKTQLDNWKQTQASIQKDMRGKNNPRYGAIVSNETKRKIGLKSKERYSDSEYKARFSECIKNSFTDEIKIKSIKSRILTDYQTVKNYCTTTDLLEFDQLIKKLKDEKMLRSRATLTSKIIIKYFSSLENLYKEGQNENNID